jgi:hypothetical protein
VDDAALDFYRTPGGMTELPRHPALSALSENLDALRRAVQGLIIHRDWAVAYDVAHTQSRVDHETNLRSTSAVLTRAFEISPDPVTTPRPPTDRVVGTCRDFTVVHTAFLRSQGIPARARCGFANYFDRTKWYDHWITERWNGERWVREDAQIDDVQAGLLNLDFDPHDQAPRCFLTGAEAWLAARAGEVDAEIFGIFDMWGLRYISGNVLTDFASINRVELLPWDAWGMMLERPEPFDDETLAVLDEIAALVNDDDLSAIRKRYEDDDELRVPSTVTSFVNGEPRRVHIDL